MNEFDFFDLTGLAFDPPVSMPKTVKAGIDSAESKLNNELMGASDLEKKEKIKKQIKFLNDCKAEYFDENKLSNEYRNISAEKLAKVIKELQAILDLRKLSGKMHVTDKPVRDHSKSLRLSEENVEKIYREAGFTISKVDPRAAYPKFPSNADKITESLKGLRKMKDPNPQGTDLTQIHDLFAFVAYLENEPENFQQYRKKSTKELQGILEVKSGPLSQRTDDFGHILSDLCAKGKTGIFDSDEHRSQYEDYLRYKEPALTDLFAKLKQIGKQQLLDADLAEELISQIQRSYPDYQTALAIYNFECFGKSDAYIPETIEYSIVCANGHISAFKDQSEAERTNKCKSCGTPLFQKCPKCGKIVLIGKDSCPYCYFHIAGAANFEQYFNEAEAALKREDFNEFTRASAKAKSADPTRTAQLDALENQHKFELAKNLTTDKRVEVCVDILSKSPEFRPAIDFLKITAPTPCTNLSVSPNAQRQTVSLSWQRSPERDVVYRVLRKEGAAGPQSEMDGSVLIDDLDSSTYQDENARTGVQYVYAVYAKRRTYGTFAKTAPGGKLLLLGEVVNFKYSIDDTTCSMAWDKPQNCTGVHITRWDAGDERVLTENAQSSFADKNLLLGRTYRYVLVSKYANNTKSSGVSFEITPFESVKPFNISSAKVSETKFDISWTGVPRGTSLRIIANGNIVAQPLSDVGKQTIDLPKDTTSTIRVEASNGGNWAASNNELDISTFTGSEIDTKKSGFNSGKLYIYFKEPIDSRIEKFSYVVRTKKRETDNPPWADISEFPSNSSDIRSVTRPDYENIGRIEWVMQPKIRDYYLTVVSFRRINGVAATSLVKKRFTAPIDVIGKYTVSIVPIIGTTSLSVNFNTEDPDGFRVIPSMCFSCGDNKLEIPQETLPSFSKSTTRRYSVPFKARAGTQTKLYSIDKATDAAYHFIKN